VSILEAQFSRCYVRLSLKTYRLYLATCSVFLPLAAAFTQTPASDQSLTANPVYEKNCAKCHGKTATGHTFGGPSLVSEKAAAASPDDLRNIIINGKGHMPKFTGKLSGDEIDTLVKQIQSLNKK
jgi:mono/diheme cytochrome c family protein